MEHNTHLNLYVFLFDVLKVGMFNDPLSFVLGDRLMAFEFDYSTLYGVRLT
jgi:hypothetical protein